MPNKISQDKLNKWLGITEDIIEGRAPEDHASSHLAKFLIKHKTYSEFIVRRANLYGMTIHDTEEQVKSGYLDNIDYLFMESRLPDMFSRLPNTIKVKWAQLSVVWHSDVVSRNKPKEMEEFD